MDKRIIGMSDDVDESVADADHIKFWWGSLGR